MDIRNILSKWYYNKDSSEQSTAVNILFYLSSTVKKQRVVFDHSLIRTK